MLIRFDSDVGGITMFGDAATELLKLMGHSGTVPGAILAEDVQDAADRLRAALDRAPESRGSGGAEDDEEDEPPVTLRQRAFPLLELLHDAARQESSVRWREG